MAKPTLLQSVLGRPSQSYSFPPEKADYHSTKPQLLRIAAEQEPPSVPDGPDPTESDDDSDQDIFYTPRSSFMSTPALDSSSAGTSISSLFEDVHSDSTHPTTRSTYTDQDWANDLVPSPPRRKPSPDPTFIPVRKSSHFAKSKSKCTPSIMTSMTALLEEDEGGPIFEQRTHPPRSNVLISSPHPLRAVSASQSQKRPERIPHTSTFPLARSSSTSSTTSPRSRTNPRAFASTHPHPHPYPRHQRSRSLTLPKTPPIVALPASTSSPYSPSLPSHGTPGYTSLILPRAPPSSIGVGKVIGVGISDEGKVDLTRSGVAQTTMASVEVVKGLGEERAGGGMFGFGGILGRRRMAAGKRSVNADGGWTLGTSGPLGFTSYRAPPSYVPAGSVLVQVWAVGIDGVDEKLLGGKVGGQNESRNGGGQEKGKGRLEVGYVPGRSFVGRVLECGWEVKEEVVRKGEWVVGLLDVRKCGALAEFIVTDRRRVHRVPHPRMAPHLIPETSSDLKTNHSYLNPRTQTSDRAPTIQPSSPVQSQASGANESLTLEELALLPLCGVPAYRAVRTFAFAFSAPAAVSGSDPTSSSHHPHSKGRSSEPGRRALVLMGHSGAGAMAVQMLVRKGWRVCVHAPGPGDGDGEREREYMRELEERIGAWGGEEVIFDDGEHFGGDGDTDGDGAVVRVMENLMEEDEVFDAVLDTVGGKGVWEVGERLLKVGGKNTKRRRQFTTLVGDVPGRAIPSAGDNFRAGLRLLRLGNVGREKDKGWQGAGDDDDLKGKGKEDRSDKGKGKGKVGYAWVSVAQDVDWEGKDVRDSVAAVLQMAVDGVARPRVGSVMPFERTPEVFAEGLRPGQNPLGDGGTVVIKIVG